MRQDKRKELTRQKILDAARAVLAKKGYGGTRIADVVKKSKLARGTFYLHFQSVEQVLNALLQEIFIDIQRYLTDMQVEALDHKNFKTALGDLAKSLLGLFEQRREIVIMLLTTPNAEPRMRAQTIWFQELMQASIKVLLDRGIASGRLRKHDSELMSFLVAGGLREILSQWLLFGRYEGHMARKVDETIALYMNGVELTRP